MDFFVRKIDERKARGRASRNSMKIDEHKSLKVGVMLNSTAYER